MGLDAAAVEAKVAELEKERDGLQERLTTVKQQLAGFRRVRDAVAALNGEKQPPRSHESAINTVLADGGWHDVKELAAALDIPESHVPGTLQSRVKRGLIESTDRGAQRTYRLAKPQQPPGLSQPVERLHGPAPQAPCPKCRPTRFVSSIGVSAGRYVYKCSNCGTSFYHEKRP